MRLVCTISRILIQLIIAGPIIVLLPFGIVFGMVSVFFGIKGEFHEEAKLLSLQLGGFGLLGLYGSIFISVKFIREFKYAKLTITILIFLGFIAAFAVFVSDSTPLSKWPSPWFACWMLGGPIFVSVWNLIRIYISPK